MKKTLSAVLLAMFLFGSMPGMAFATSGPGVSSNVESLLSQIANLMRQINELQTQVKTLRGDIRTVVKEERKEEREDRKEEKKKDREDAKRPILIRCADGEGYYAWNKKGKGKHKGEWKKFIRYCKKNGTGTSTDNVAPSISSITVSGVTANSAVINWVTNEASNSVVTYGTTTAYGATSTNVSLVTNHSITLTGLAANTLHNFVVRSSDVAGNLVVSSNVTFTTLSTTPSDVVSPIISSVAVSSITPSGATITWTTNEPSDSQVNYGTTLAYGATTTLDSSPVTSHSVTLSGLSSSTLYNIVVRSKDVSNNLAVSPNVSFTTNAPADTAGPVISAISAVVATSTASVQWTTNETSNSKIYYGTANPLVLGSATVLSNASLVTAHVLALSGLATSTTYYYVVESVDALANVSTSSQQSFTTGN